MTKWTICKAQADRPESSVKDQVYCRPRALFCLFCWVQGLTFSFHSLSFSFSPPHAVLNFFMYCRITPFIHSALKRGYHSRVPPRIHETAKSREPPVIGLTGSGVNVINGAHSLLRAVEVIPENFCLGFLCWRFLLDRPITHWWPIMTGGAELSTCALALDRGEYLICAVEAEGWVPEYFLLAVSKLGYGGTDIEVIHTMSIGSVEDFELVYTHVCLHRRSSNISSAIYCLGGPQFAETMPSIK